MFTRIAFAVVFGAALLSSGNGFRDEVLERVATWYRAQAEPLGILSGIFEGLLKQLEGERTWTFEEVVIDDKNRFSDVTVSSLMDVHRVIQESGSNLLIKNLTLSIHSLNVTGGYQFEDLLLPGGIPIYGDGNFTLKFQDLKPTIMLDLNVNLIDNKVEVWDVALDVSLGDSYVRFDNLMDNDPMGGFLNDIMKGVIDIVVDIAPKFVEVYKDQVKEALEDMLNQILE